MVNSQKVKIFAKDTVLDGVCAQKCENELIEETPKRLPPEIWGLIMENINDPGTLFTCTNTCSMMSKLLCKRKTRFLFPEVLQILISGKYLTSQEDFLNCRLVCKSWRSALLESFSSPDDWKDHLFHRHHSMTNSAPPTKPLVSTFSSYEESSDFLLQMSSRCTPESDSPFPSNTIQFGPQNFASDEEQQNHYVNFIHVLKQFGKHVSHLIYHCPGGDDCRRPHGSQESLEEKNNAHIVIWLKLILMCMPNLQRLTIYRFLRHPAAVQNQYPDLPHLRPRAFPRLPKFQYLEIHDDSLLPYVKQALLEAYGHQLYRFHCRDSSTWEEQFRFNERNPQQIEFPSLNEVKIEWVMKAENCLRGLNTLEMPSLQKLAIDFNFILFPGRVTLTDVLSLLNRFGSTLTDLYLPLQVTYLDPSNLEDSFELMNVTLPKLERLWIGSAFNNHSILRALLRKFPALKQLHFTDYQAPPRHFGRFAPGKLQVAMLQKEKNLSLKEFCSNVQDLWNICPKLRLVELIRNQPVHERVYSVLKPV